MLGEFGRGKSKHRPRNDKRLYTDGKYPFLQTGRVRNSAGRISEYDALYSDFGLAQSKIWPKGTICITIAANIAESGILEIDACFPDSVVGLVPHPEVSGEYVECFIRTAKENLDRYAPATAQKNINLEMLSAVAVPLPPSAEQAEIKNRIDEAFSNIRFAEKVCETELARSGALRQSILKDAFAGRLIPQDPADEPAADLLARIKANRVSAPDKPRRKAAV
jgi:type I restriction enzyme S subunit